MIQDVTDHLKKEQAAEITEALTILIKHFSRETLSAAIGEVSEILVAKYMGAERERRGSPGHDLILPDGNLIEVKSRFLSLWGDKVQFNFSKHTAKAQISFCVVWTAAEGQLPNLDMAFKIPVPFLLQTWGTPKQEKYCARTTLGKIRSNLKTH